MQEVIALLIVVGVAAAGIWDVYVAYGPGPQFSVSALLGQLAERFPPLLLFVGILVGHLFWPRASVHDVERANNHTTPAASVAGLRPVTPPE